MPKKEVSNNEKFEKINSEEEIVFKTALPETIMFEVYVPELFSS